MRYQTIVATILFPALLVSGALFAGETEDPWRGKSVDEVTAVLGSPDQVKQSGSVRTLIYKLMLPGDTPPLDSRIRLLQLPGVGLVAQYLDQNVKGAEKMDYDPTHVDEDGRVVAGGFNPETSASMSYSSKSGEIERDWEEGPDPGKVKKITLKVVVDDQGRVSDWTVSPKKYMKTGSGS